MINDPEEMPMRRLGLAIGTIAALFVFSGCVQDDQRGHARFDDHDQQVTRDWYSQHRDHPPEGLRNEDRLSADEESRLREGSVLDERLRSKVHDAPQELARQLPPPAPNHRYVAIGGHVALIDNKNQVKSVIHVHDQ
jgi:Ni/Co efflux regulator RcnB